MHIFLALCCLALAMNDLQSFEQHLIVSSLTLTWQYPAGVLDVEGPNTQYMDGDTCTDNGRSPAANWILVNSFLMLSPQLYCAKLGKEENCLVGETADFTLSMCLQLNSCNLLLLTQTALFFLQSWCSHKTLVLLSLVSCTTRQRSSCVLVLHENILKHPACTTLVHAGTSSLGRLFCFSTKEPPKKNPHCLQSLGLYRLVYGLLQFGHFPFPRWENCTSKDAYSNRE